MTDQSMTPERAREVLVGLRGPWADMLDKLATSTFDAAEVEWHKRKSEEVAALTHALAALDAVAREAALAERLQQALRAAIPIGGGEVCP